VISVTTPSGTAASPTSFVVQHRQALSISVSALRAQGTLRAVDGYKPCTRGTQVRVARLVNGVWRLVGTDTTDAAGRYSVAGTGIPGWYRAVTIQRTLASGDVCLYEKTASVKL
jgi:hypothetical protein